MKNDIKLTEEQQSRVAATLARIRGGLARFRATEQTEPALIFKPEAFDDHQS